MDEFEIERLLHIKNKEPQFVESRQEYIEKFAVKQVRTFDELSDAIYLIAAFLDATGIAAYRPIF